MCIHRTCGLSAALQTLEHARRWSSLNPDSVLFASHMIRFGKSVITGETWSSYAAKSSFCILKILYRCMVHVLSYKAAPIGVPTCNNPTRNRQARSFSRHWAPLLLLLHRLPFHTRRSQGRQARHDQGHLERFGKTAVVNLQCRAEAVVFLD